MKTLKVWYTYDTYTLSCGCCSDAQSEVEFREYETDGGVTVQTAHFSWQDPPAFGEVEELVEYVKSVFPKATIEVQEFSTPYTYWSKE